MKIIITGATGLIGKRLCNQLKQNGFDVEFLKRHDYNKAMSQKDWSSRKNIFWSNPEVLENATAVIHLAGANVSRSWTKKYKEEILMSRKIGTEALLSACAACKIPPKHIISASGIGIYPENSKEELNESSKHGTGFLSEVCKIWENTLLNSETPGIQKSCLRTGIVFSNNSKVFHITKLQFLYSGMVGSVGNPRNTWSWIHIDDLCNLYLALVKGTMPPGIYNAVAPHTCSQKEMGRAFEAHSQNRKDFNTFLQQLQWGNACRINKLIRFLGITIRPILPAFLMKLIWGERSIIALTNQNVSAKKTLDTGFCYQYPTIDSAMEHLHKNPLI